MTKPQFSTEPSMEDILASIRKMISEERLGPRPIPDQIGRSPFGESIAEAPRSEPGPAERPAPSFSSLSDALKAATPTPEQRRTLEEKIADMLENGALPRPASPTDSLAVFAASRSAPVTSPDLGAFGEPRRGPSPERTSARQTPTSRELPRSTRPGARLPEAPLNGFNGSAHALGLNGSAHSTEGADTATVVPLNPEAPTAPREDASGSGPTLSTSAKHADGASPASAPKSADTQRIIAMPSRLGAASPSAAPSTTPPSAGSGTNGASVSSLSPRPVTGGRHSFRPTSPLRDPDNVPGPGAGSNKIGETERDSTLAARSTDAGSKLGDSVIRGDAPAGPDASVIKEPHALRREAAKPPFGPLADAPGPIDAVPPGAGRAGADPTATSEASSGETFARPNPDQPFAKSATSGGAPSDALVDAVVALVHKEPDTLSVFTSGSAFIHGVTEEAAAPAKPGPNMARKLDRSAAELLRPMLRQWLADNMPRIVEEALRSELMNSQEPAKEPDKG